MRLTYKFTLLYLIISAMVFLIGINISINSFLDEVKDEVDFELRSDLAYLSSRIKKGVDYELLSSENKMIHVNTTLIRKEGFTSFADTLAYSTSQGSLIKQRRLIATKTINGISYNFLLLNSLVETKDAYHQSIKSLGLIYLILFFGVAFIGYFLSKLILKPFNTTLQTIYSFDLKKSPELFKPKRTSTKEFKLLNQFLEKMISKAVKDYKLLKEFSENASHEMQTPIAVAKGKLELLSNSKNIDEGEAKLIGDAQTALATVSSLEKSLSLLSKLDNEEFLRPENINFSMLLKSILKNFEELIQLKCISLNKTIIDDIFVIGNSDLLKILITNLIKNAIQHNVESGFISIELNTNYFEISNSGKTLNTDTDVLFNRFKKNDQSTASLGLGLSIVKKIIDFHNFQINYSSLESTHSIKVFF